MFVETKEELQILVERLGLASKIPCIVDVWGVDDILDAFNCEEDALTREQAAHILAVAYKRLDCSRGLNWERFENIAMELYPEEFKRGMGFEKPEIEE